VYPRRSERLRTACVRAVLIRREQAQPALVCKSYLPLAQSLPACLRSACVPLRLLSNLIGPPLRIAFCPPRYLRATPLTLTNAVFLLGGLPFYPLSTSHAFDCGGAVRLILLNEGDDGIILKENGNTALCCYQT
jgi:hypothetical protein